MRGSGSPGMIRTMNTLTLEEQLVYYEVVSKLQTVPPEHLDRAVAIAVVAAQAGDAQLLQHAFDALHSVDRPAVWQ
jgi:hypothetical protein